MVSDKAPRGKADIPARQGSLPVLKQILNDQQRKHHSLGKYLSYFSGFLMVLFFYAAIVASSEEASGTMRMLGIAAATGFLAGLSMHFRSHFEPGKHPLLEALNQYPENIVWVYTQAQFLAFSHVIDNDKKEWLVCGMADGLTYDLRVGSEEEYHLILEFLLKKCPKATFGYSRELHDIFLKDSAALLKN